jgi:hypothetical protein
VICLQILILETLILEKCLEICLDECEDSHEERMVVEEWVENEVFE